MSLNPWHIDTWQETGAPLCIMRCMRESVLLIDGEPHCLDCADSIVDRAEAVEISPSLRDVLPALTHGAEERELFRKSKLDLNETQTPELPKVMQRQQRADEGEALGPTWICVTCSHQMYLHGMRKEPNNGKLFYTSCRVEGCHCTLGRNHVYPRGAVDP